MSKLKCDFLIVIPHYKNEGGAGRYINSLLSEFRKDNNVDIIGPYANNYINSETKRSVFESIFPKHYFHFIYPNYLGVRFIFKLYFFIRILYFSLKSLIRKCQSSDSQMVIVLTSSIQIPLLLIIKKNFNNAKVIVLIQENYLLASFSSKILNKILLKADLVVSISESWIKDSLKFGIKAFLLRNIFDNTDTKYVIKDIEYDILFLGGNQSIKGSQNFIDLLKYAVLKGVKLKVAWLGNLDKTYLQKIDKIEKDSYITVSKFGFVNNIEEFLLKTRLVVFQIEKAHFLRPAIEAGLCKKTFIIKNIPGIEDFAIQDYNCLMYHNIDEALNLIIKLLNNDKLRANLEINNFDFATKFTQSSFTDLNQFTSRINSLFN